MADYQRNRCPFCGQTEEWMVWVNRLHRQESFAECGKCLIKGPVVAGKDSVEAFILQYRRWENNDVEALQFPCKPDIFEATYEEVSE